MPAIVLASSSSYRAELLNRLGLQFQQISPDIDETPMTDESPDQLCSRLAQDKAQAVAEKLSQPALIIASDQVACLDNRLFGKPGNFENALQQLNACNGKQVSFYTSLYLLNSQTQQHYAEQVPFHVNFRRLSAKQIENYLIKEQPFDCAGSFKAEGLGIALFSAMRGDDPNALIGLPLIALCSGLQQLGVDVLA